MVFMISFSISASVMPQYANIIRYFVKGVITAADALMSDYGWMKMQKRSLAT
jgi:hypothetical protein